MYATSASQNRQFLFFVRYQQEFLRSSSSLAVCFLVVMTTQGYRAQKHLEDVVIFHISLLNYLMSSLCIFIWITQVKIQLL